MNYYDPLEKPIHNSLNVWQGLTHFLKCFFFPKITCHIWNYHLIFKSLHLHLIHHTNVLISSPIPLLQHLHKFQNTTLWCRASRSRHSGRAMTAGSKGVGLWTGSYYFKRQPGWTNLRGVWGKRAVTEEGDPATNGNTRHQSSSCHSWLSLVWRALPYQVLEESLQPTALPNGSGGRFKATRHRPVAIDREMARVEFRRLQSAKPDWFLSNGGAEHVASSPHVGVLSYRTSHLCLTLGPDRTSIFSLIL